MKLSETAIVPFPYAKSDVVYLKCIYITDETEEVQRHQKTHLPTTLRNTYFWSSVHMFSSFFRLYF